MRSTRYLLLAAVVCVSSSTLLGQTADVIRETSGPTPATAAPAPVVVVPDLTGCWSGCWFSCKNGHKGPLSAEFCKLSDTCYRVSFRGRFWKVFPFRYTTTMTVTGYTADGQVMLSSAQRLGPILGDFTMCATATGCHFDADFRSKNDWGKFVMNRN